MTTQQQSQEPKKYSIANPPALTQQHINWIVIGLMIFVFIILLIKN